MISMGEKIVWVLGISIWVLAFIIALFSHANEAKTENLTEPATVASTSSVSYAEGSLEWLYNNCMDTYEVVDVDGAKAGGGKIEVRVWLCKDFLAVVPTNNELAGGVE